MTATTSHELDGINLADPEAFRRNEAHQMFRVLRAQDRLHWNEGTDWFPGFWSVVTYEDVLAVSRDPATFISSKGINMMTDPENPSSASGLGKMLITMDPPRHVRLRRLVNKGFTPRAVSVLEPHIRGIATSIIEDIAEQGRCDFVTEIAALLPLAVICEMMGVSRDDRQLMFELTNRVLGADDPEYQTASGSDGDARRATAEQGQREMFGYFMRLLGERRAERRDDLVSVLVTRVATRDVQLHDTLIRAGERVCLWYPSANRDEAVFDDPYTFDIGREPNDHLAFGIGEHFCLGAGFARLELKVMFEELLDRLPDIAPDGESERLRSTFIGGIKRMPVRYTAQTRSPSPATGKDGTKIS